MSSKQLKWYISWYHNFFVFLPIFVLVSLILFVYLSYLLNYCMILLSVPSNPEQAFLLELTTNRDEAFTKGIILTSIITFVLTMLLISLFRTVFMDPGYFKGTLELEHKIVTAQSIKKKYNKVPIKKATYNRLNIKSKDKQDLENYLNQSQIQLEESESEWESKYDIDPTISKAEKRRILDLDNYKLEDRIQFLTEFNDIISSGPLTSLEQCKLKCKIEEFLSPDDVLNGQENGKTTQVNSPMNIDEHFKSIELNKAMLCGTCLRYKVERSHHCKQCGKCVLKMDHHCPWLANCIGFRNYKYFLLIEFHGILASVIILLTYWESILGYNMSIDSTLTECWFSAFSYFCTIGLFGFLLWLMLINWKLALTGQTVIENSDRERYPLNKTVNVYDLGYYKNFVAVFGNNPLLWFLPFGANYEGNGIVFENIYSNVSA